MPLADIKNAIRDFLPDLLTETVGDERNVVLTLSRMWLTATTGDIASKDIASVWAENQAPPKHARLLKYAREGYLGRIKDRWEDKYEGMEELVLHMKKKIEENLGDL